MVLNEFAIKKNVTIVMIVIGIIVFGIVSFRSVGVNLMPNADLPFITIMTIIPGAAPDTVETNVSTKIEDAVSTLSGIRSISSISSESLSYVMIEFELESDIDIAAQDVRDKVSGIIGDLPDDAESPIVQKYDPLEKPILSLVITTNEEISKATKYIEDYIKEPLQNVKGVGSIDLIGGRERAIRIWIDPTKLKRYGLTTSNIEQILAVENIDIPGGSIEEGNNDITLKINAKLKSVEEFKDIVVKYYNGANVKLSDVARIEDGLSEKENVANFNLKNAISLDVKKQSGGNVVKVATDIKEKLDEIKRTLSKNYEITIAYDDSTYINHSINSVFEDIIIGGILAIIITLLFLSNLRATIIVSVVLPSVLIGVFTFISVMGFTVNIMTTLAMSICVGILIDDAIVMIENIFRHFEMGKDKVTASKDGAGEISFAVLSIALVIMSVFIPVAFMKGMIGKFFLEFGLTVAFLIGLSAFFSLTLTPMLASRFLKEVEKPFILFRLINKALDKVVTAYKGILSFALNHRFLILMIGIFVLATSFYIVRFVPSEMTPSEDRSTIYVDIKAPAGTSLDLTEKITNQFQEILQQDIKVIESLYSTVAADTQKSKNKSTITIKLTPKKTRDISQQDVTTQIRERIKELNNIKVFSMCEFTVKQGSIGTSNKDLTYNIYGNDIKTLNEIAEKMIIEWQKIPGLLEVTSSYEAGKPEMKLSINRKKAATLGIASAQIASTLYTLFEGKDISTFEDAGEQYNVNIMLEKSFRNKVDDLNEVYIKSPYGEFISLNTLIDMEVGESAAQIDRQDRRKTIKLTANIDRAIAKSGELMPKIEEVTKKMNLPAGYSASFEGMAKVQKESFESMAQALILAIILIYLIIASQFNSFIHPFTIMMALPFTVSGAFILLFMTQLSLNIFSMIGMIMLMGLVSRNSILLIEFTVQKRATGLSKHEALLTACPLRIRPILMTTFAMIFGMLPIALNTGEGAELRAPMAVAVIGGLITATVLTLVVVPVIYSFFDNFTIENIRNWKIIKKFKDIKTKKIVIK